MKNISNLTEKEIEELIINDLKKTLNSLVNNKDHEQELISKTQTLINSKPIATNQEGGIITDRTS